MDTSGSRKRFARIIRLDGTVPSQRRNPKGAAREHRLTAGPASSRLPHAAAEAATGMAIAQTFVTSS